MSKYERKACGGTFTWRARGVIGCSKQCRPDEVVTGTTIAVACSCGTTVHHLILNNYREPTRRRQRSPTPPAVKVEPNEEE
jgi:hypothetical protein